jgi:DNA-binding NtrC family response regulator
MAADDPNKVQTPVLVLDDTTAATPLVGVLKQYCRNVESITELGKAQRLILEAEEKPRLLVLDLDWPYPVREPAYRFIQWLRGRGGEVGRNDPRGQYPRNDLLKTGLCGLVLMANKLGETDLGLILKQTLHFLLKRDLEKFHEALFSVEKEMACRRTFMLVRPAPEGVVGEHPDLLNSFLRAKVLAQMDGHVFVYGGVGTGKELAARHIHDVSEVPGQFLARDIREIPVATIAFHSYMFGHLKGSWTGANTTKIGIVDEAANGTLLFDNLQYAPHGTQAKLLRFLQEGEYRPYGETGAYKKLTARVICAVSEPPEKLIEGGRLLPDLYRRFYHSNGLLYIPPVRKRGGDVLLLARHFCARWTGPKSAPLKGLMRLSPKAEDLLLNCGYRWPQNVSDVSGKVTEACMNAYLDCRTLVEPVDFRFPPGPGSAPVPPAPTGVSLAEIREDAERRAIVQALQATKGEVKAAAARLGISRQTLHEKMNQHQIKSTGNRG